MAIQFHDISYAQGQYNMDADPAPLIFMKMSGFYYGSKVGYYDAQAARNYNNAVRLGKVPGLYHFAGGGDPVAEADFFIGACSPLAENDVLILDYELGADMNPPANPAAWCEAFVNRVHERTGVWPLFYTYSSMLRQYGFDAVLRNCGLWIADYTVSPDGTVNTGGRPYIAHQFQGSPIDTNALFISIETLKKYGYHAPKPAPVPVPVPVSQPPKEDPHVPQPTPTPPPEPVPAPTPEPPKPENPPADTPTTGEPETPPQNTPSEETPDTLALFITAFKKLMLSIIHIFTKGGTKR